MILGFNRGEDYIEVLCGTTNKVYGDYVGRLKINNKGMNILSLMSAALGVSWVSFPIPFLKLFFLSHAIIDL